MATITLWVGGIPRPGGSKRHVGGGRMIDAGKHTASWRNMVATVAVAQYKGPILRGPLRVVMVFDMPRPKGHFRKDGTVKPSAPRYHTIKPDATKLARAAEDALTGIVWADDAQIVHQENYKVYICDGKPGVSITIEEI